MDGQHKKLGGRPPTCTTREGDTIGGCWKHSRRLVTLTLHICSKRCVLQVAKLDRFVRISKGISVEIIPVAPHCTLPPSVQPQPSLSGQIQLGRAHDLTCHPTLVRQSHTTVECSYFYKPWTSHPIKIPPPSMSAPSPLHHDAHPRAPQSPTPHLQIAHPPTHSPMLRYHHPVTSVPMQEIMQEGEASEEGILRVGG